jgi:hypothetical protein
MNKSHILFALFAAILSTACNTTFPAVDNANYIIENVQVHGPGGPGTYVLSWDVRILNNGGAASPVISLVDEDDFLRFGDDLLYQEQVTSVPDPAVAGVHPQQRLIDLGCSPARTVVFGTPSIGVRDSGEDQAEVYGQISRADGSGMVRGPVINVVCQ